MAQINSNPDRATERGVKSAQEQKAYAKSGRRKDYEIAYGAHEASNKADEMTGRSSVLLRPQSGADLPDAKKEVRPSEPYLAGNINGSKANSTKTNRSTTDRNAVGQDNNAWEQAYGDILYEWIMDVKSNMFAYQGLPDTVNTRWLEQLLAYTGFASVGLNQVGELVVYGSAQGAGYNPYGDGLSVVDENFWGGGQVIEKVDISQEDGDPSVDLTPVSGQVTRSHPNSGTFVTFRNKQTWNNVPATDMGRVEFFARELANIAALSRSVRLKMRTPYIVATKKGQLSRTAVMNAIRAGEEVIEISESMNIEEAIQVLTLDVPVDYMPRLKDEFNNKLSEMLTMFGINNIGVDKKERLVAAEAEGNNQLINASGNVYLDSRREAVELLNIAFKGKVAGFDGNATVDWNMATIQSLQGLSLESVEEGIIPNGKTDDTFAEKQDEAQGDVEE